MSNRQPFLVGKQQPYAWHLAHYYYIMLTAFISLIMKAVAARVALKKNSIQNKSNRRVAQQATPIECKCKFRFENKLYRELIGNSIVLNYFYNVFQKFFTV